MNEERAIETVRLERLKAVLAVGLGRHFAMEAHVDILESMRGGLMAHIVQPILGREMERITYRYPADWKQAVKERWAPAWVLRRWPVAYQEGALVANELYPSVALPQLDPVICLDVEKRHSA